MGKHLHPNDMHMTIGEHLDELRRRLIAALVGIFVVACVMLSVGQRLIGIICLPLFHAQHTLNLQQQTYSFSPMTGFTIYLKVSLIGGLIVASPWVVYQIWRFVAAGLYVRERRVVLVVMPFSAAMTTAGVLFMYFIMLPACLWFFLNFAISYPDTSGTEPGFVSRLIDRASEVEPRAPSGLSDTAKPSDQSAQRDQAQPAVRLPIVCQDPVDPIEGQVWVKTPENMLRVHVGGYTPAYLPVTTTMMSPLIEIGQYINMVTVLTVGIVVAFQVPVVMLILGWTGLVSPDWIVQYRRHCLFGCFVLGALLTPSDVLSMLLLAVPLWALFEFGLLLMRVTRRHPGAIDYG